MINVYDILYGLAVGMSAPYWFLRGGTRGKVLRAFSQRMGRVAPRAGNAPAVMIHAVSLGEINATRALIDLLRRERPGLQFIVSTTTETGYARGQDMYGSASDVQLVRYPLDFSGAVNRTLQAARPAVVVLMELEVWPNFIRACGKQNIPVLLINGRVTAGSFERYKLARILVAPMFRRLSRVCAQDSTYAERFIALGAVADRVSITGTMKFDTAQIVDRVAGQDELAAAVGLRPGVDRIWVCGSTGPGEEMLILDEYRRLLKRFPNLRLAIVPRKPERFDEVAQAIMAAGFPVVRRSNPQIPLPGDVPPVVLGDTMGELRKFYAIAEVVVVGRTLVDLGPRQHGSDMIEPAALGKPVIVGPYTGNFAEVMNQFRMDDAMLVVKNSLDMGQAVAMLLDQSDKAMAMGQRARQVVRGQQGATARHAELILQILDTRKKNARGDAASAV